jgi:two-component system, LytTR family, response regulator
MIRSIIVDDESSARRTLSIMLKTYLESQVEVICEASSVQEAIAAIKKNKPDLVFLDIEMQDGTGFDVLQSLDTIDFQVVFVTAYEHYAFQSFRFAAIDYLLKPIRAEDLRQSIGRATKWGQPQIKTGQEFATMKSKVDSTDTKGQVLLVSELDGFSIVRSDEIIYCEAAKNYTIFHFIDGRKITASRSIGDFEVLLSELGFMRIHKSYIVNLSKIMRYIKGRGGEVAMVDKMILPVGRERKQELLEYFEGRFGSIQ